MAVVYNILKNYTHLNKPKLNKLFLNQINQIGLKLEQNDASISTSA